MDYDDRIDLLNRKQICNLIDAIFNGHNFQELAKQIDSFIITSF